MHNHTNITTHTHIHKHIPLWIKHQTHTWDGLGKSLPPPETLCQLPVCASHTGDPSGATALLQQAGVNTASESAETVFCSPGEPQPSSEMERKGWGQVWPLVCVCMLSCFCCVRTVAARLLCPWDCPGKNIGVDCHSLLQGIFPIQGLNPSLLHSRQILYPLSHLGSLMWLFKPR